GMACWAGARVLLYAEGGCPAPLRALARVGGARARPPGGAVGWPPAVSLIGAAYNEAGIIERKVRDALALDYPRERLEVIVSCDGCADDTAARARAAGADLVLENPRGGKVRAQDAAVDRARGEIVAFSDANASWEPGALGA